MKKTLLTLSLAAAAALFISGCASDDTAAKTAAAPGAPKGNPNKVEIFNGSGCSIDFG